jgi:hypothetical protein
MAVLFAWRDQATPTKEISKRTSENRTRVRFFQSSFVDK